MVGSAACLIGHSGVGATGIGVAAVGRTGFLVVAIDRVTAASTLVAPVVFGARVGIVTLNIVVGEDTT